ncbi:MAG TPA: ATP-binding cassette domain-containing protein, partial [Coriobacteriia bacterium]|nr:ATP-binding cassette domain-containing protein [Coriobacteriia bacterium]
MRGGAGVVGLIGSSTITSICAVESVGGTHEEDGESEGVVDPGVVVGVEDDGEEFQYHSGAGDLDLAGEATDRKWSIRCVDVVKRLAGIPVLNGLNVAIPDDMVTVVLGPSGTGKSVLIKHLIGLMFPDSGDVQVLGNSVPKLTMPKLLELRRRIGVLFQDGALFGSMSVFDNVAFPLRQHTGMSESQIGERVRQRLAD